MLLVEDGAGTGGLVRLETLGLTGFRLELLLSPPDIITDYSIRKVLNLPIKNSPNALRAIVCDNNVLARFVELNGRFFNVKLVIV